MHADNEAAHIVCVLQQCACLNRNGEVVAGNAGFLAAAVGGSQSIANIAEGKVKPGKQGWIKMNINPVGHAAHGVDIPGSGHTLERDFQHVGQAGEFFSSMPIDRIIKGQCHHRYIINAFGLDDRLSGAQIRRQPVLVRIHLIIKLDQRFVSWNANFKLHSNNGLTLAGHGIHVFNASNFAHHLFSRGCDSAFYFLSAGARKSHHDICHGDIYLRLLFLRRHHNRKHTQNDGEQRQQRR